MMSIAVMAIALAAVRVLWWAAGVLVIRVKSLVWFTCEPSPMLYMGWMDGTVYDTLPMSVENVMMGSLLRFKSNMHALSEYKDTSVLFVWRSWHNGDNCFVSMEQLEANAAASKQAKTFCSSSFSL